MRLVYRFAVPRYLYELIWFAFNGSRLKPSMVRCLVPLFRGFDLTRLLWYGNMLGLSPVWSFRELSAHYSMGKECPVFPLFCEFEFTQKFYLLFLILFILSWGSYIHWVCFHIKTRKYVTYTGARFSPCWVLSWVIKCTLPVSLTWDIFFYISYNSTE